MKSDGDPGKIVTARRREWAALEARYEAINQAWQDAGIPTCVLQTPDWESGWRVLMNWLKPHVIGACGQAAWSEPTSPIHMSSSRNWANEVHIFSHVCSPVSGHCSEHATIEEQGARAILGWWQSTRSVGYGRNANRWYGVD